MSTQAGNHSSSLILHLGTGALALLLAACGSGGPRMLRHLIGLEEPMSGKITIAGVGAPRLEVSRPRFGVMFQSDTGGANRERQRRPHSAQGRERRGI